MHNTNSANSDPSEWLRRHASKIKPGGRVLDVAAGSGRNARWLAGQGFAVEAVDKDVAALDTMRDIGNITRTVADLENTPWPYVEKIFDAIVVCRYLHRPLLPLLASGLARDGVLVYETFMLGHEKYGRPQNPDFLLRPNELLQMFHGLKIVAFEQGLIQQPKPAIMQRICAVNTLAA